MKIKNLLLTFTALLAPVWKYSCVLFNSNINCYRHINVLVDHDLKILVNNHRGYERLFIDSDDMAEHEFHVLCKPELHASKGSC